MRNLRIHEKNVEKRKNFKMLLQPDADDIKFVENLKKRDADKILLNKNARGKEEQNNITNTSALT